MHVPNDYSLFAHVCYTDDMITNTQDQPIQRSDDQENTQPSVWDRIKPEKEIDPILTLEQFEAVLLRVARPVEDEKEGK